jgi:hypothetical protein
LESSAIVCSGITNSTVLETLAYREALALASDLIYQKVVITSECKGVVEDIQRGNGGRNENIIRKIGTMAKGLDSCL